MNRLVILGNGFDLAHGLPTSYKDFLNDFWKNLKTEYPNDTYSKFLFIDDGRYSILDKSYQSFKNFTESLKSYSERYSGEVSFDNEKSSLIGKKGAFINKPVVEFKNSFFLAINKKDSINNWVDIENQYYQELKKIVKENDDEDKRLIKVKKLHKEFDDIKALLKNYLKEKVHQEYLKSNNIKSNKSFDNHFIIEHLTGKGLINYCSEFPKEDEDEIKAFNEKLKSTGNNYKIENAINQNNLNFTNVFLNFNYTNTIEKYSFNSYTTDYHGENRQINIHGQLELPDDNIIFGFGDEMDDDYSTIEKLDDNEYLKNFKSFQYTLNHNYKRLLDFIGSNKFQVYIMGHSCGLSDRILLNTIFEHENCRSIKVFYRKKGDGTDNYTNLVQNISRHFNDKALMRKKLVNKLLCKPLI